MANNRRLLSIGEPWRKSSKLNADNYIAKKMGKMEQDYDYIKNELTKKGYRWFNGDPFDLNLVVVREGKNTDEFDDVLWVCFLENGSKKAYSFPCTADPGLPYLLNPMNPGGAAAIAPGQYRACWEYAPKWLHGRYDCLRQVGNISYYRDNNRDNVYDYQPQSIQTRADVGLCLHGHLQATETATRVGNSSAGCVVLKSNHDYHFLWALFGEQINAGYGSRFTLTLLEG